MYPEIVMCLAYTSKKCEFWRPHLRRTPLWYSQILSNFIFSYLPILKILSVQHERFSFEFWCPCLRGIPSFWYSQTLSNFIFSLFLPILKISSVQRKWLNFEFWRTCLKRITSFCSPQISSKFIFSSYLHIRQISCI